MSNRSTATNIDEYIAEFPPETAAILQQVRELIREMVPDATETISYAIPTFDLSGKHFMHFAGFAKHIGLYPANTLVQEAFSEELKPYKTGKGSIQFPLDKPIPFDLIRRIVEFRLDQSTHG